MKRIITLLLLVASLYATAQTVTQNVGNNKTVVFDQSMTGPYKMLWNDKSRNGGTVSKTWSGKLENGHRVGLWQGKATYQNYEYAEGRFWQGTSTIVRNYVDGKPSGSYSVVDNIKWRTGRYNHLRGVWEYGVWQEQTTIIKGSFKSGIPIGSWEIKSTDHGEYIIFSLMNDGNPDGNYSWNGSIRKFKSGYLIEETDMQDAGTWGIKLSYTPEEISEFTPEAAECKPFIISNYAEYYLLGATWEDEIRNYPYNSSEDPISTGEYMVVEPEKHQTYIGNVPDWYLEMKGQDEASLKRKKNESQAKAFYDKYINGYESSKKHKYDILSCGQLNEILYWKPIIEREHITQEVAQSYDKLGMIYTLSQQQEEWESFYKQQLATKIRELKEAKYEFPNNQELEEHVISLVEMYDKEWKKFLNECKTKYLMKKLEDGCLVLSDDDIVAYLLGSGKVRINHFNNNVLEYDKKMKITASNVREFKKQYYITHLNTNEDGVFSWNDYNYNSLGITWVYRDAIDRCMKDKRFVKFLEKLFQ